MKAKSMNVGRRDAKACRNTCLYRTILINKHLAVFSCQNTIFPLCHNEETVKVSKAFKQMASSRLELATPGSREKHLNLLSHRGVLFLINPGTTIRNRAPPNPPTQPC